ncbi:sortase [Butyrivibrio sp. VCB2006]|uniref:sortase n=1 Tax=Butyrivibrio sp. VCB2006 TaxID=1280679 RepID=UPI000492C1AF|nr:sortase [Butyrivibrio sp. VCB2006]
MKKIVGYIYILMGAACILIAAIIIRNNLNENAQAGSASDEFLEGVIAQIPDTVLAASGDMPVVDVEGHSFIGTVEIPSLGLLLPVQNEWDKANAKYAVCRYTGSVYDNDLIIAGHNYDEHFGKLKELNTGDDVIVTDMNGISFYFKVSNIETLGPMDSDKMKSGDWDLTLFTCTIGGANRVTVRCEATGEYTETGATPDVLDAAEKSKHIRK